MPTKADFSKLTAIQALDASTAITNVVHATPNAFSFTKEEFEVLTTGTSGLDGAVADQTLARNNLTAKTEAESVARTGPISTSA